MLPSISHPLPGQMELDYGNTWRRMILELGWLVGGGGRTLRSSESQNMLASNPQSRP